MKQLNMAFFGAGMVANLHAEAVNRSQRTRLIGLWNRTKDLAIQKATMFECKPYDDVDTLLAEPEIDAISILTNLESHHFLALKAIEAGKHVLVEKPVGLTVSEIENIRDAAYKKGVVCMPGHNYIYEDSIQRSNELISTGKLGEIASIYILYNIVCVYYAIYIVCIVTFVLYLKPPESPPSTLSPLNKSKICL